MKKILFIASIVASALGMTSCNNDEIKNVGRPSPMPFNHGIEQAAPKPEPPKDTILRNVPLTEQQFRRIANYIEKHGFVVDLGPNRIKCGHQVTFFDKAGNRHAMISCRTGADGHPAMKGTVTSISVWAYYDGKKDQEHFFGYDIRPSGAKTFITEDDYMAKHMKAVQKGVNDFLNKVEKSKS